MQVKTGDRVCLDAGASVEPIDDLLFHDYYSRTPRIRLTASSATDASQPQTATEVVLDANDVAKLVECAIRHPSLNMRHSVLTAIWNHPDSFKQIFHFGLDAPLAFSEIRNIVAAELAACAAPACSPAAGPIRPAVETLLPRLPLPAHLRANRGSK